MSRAAVRNVLFFFTLCAALPLPGQSLVKQIEVPGTPGSIAVDPFTNRIYVAQNNWDESSGATFLSAIDGSTNTVVWDTGWIPDTVGNLALDYVTGNLYAVTCRYLWVAEPFCDLRVFDASQIEVARITDVAVQSPLAVNPITHRLYYARESAPGLAVLDTRTNRYLGSIGLNGRWPTSLDVDLAGNRVFVIAEGVRLVIVDGRASKVLLNKPIARSSALAVDASRRQVYVAQGMETDAPGNVAIFDSSTLLLKTKIQVGAFPRSIAADLFSGFVFVTSYNQRFCVINGNNLKLRKTIIGPTGPVAVNPYTRTVYTGSRTIFIEPIVGKVDVIRE